MVTADTLHKRATRVLPEVIQTSGVLLPDTGQRSIAALLFPLRRRSSGSLAYRVSAQTIEDLSLNPIGYLTQATSAREGIGRHAKPFAYRPWRRILLPLAWLDADRLTSAPGHSTRSEAYFTTKTDGKALLVLIPEERLLVYVWND